MRNFTLRKFNSFKLISLVLLLTVTSISSFAQVCGTPGGDGPIAITGSINTYFPVSGDTDLNVGAQAILLAASPGTDSKLNNFGTTPISVGDLILIIQMQDATIDYSNNQAYGSRTTNSGKDGLGGTGFLNINNTGIFEYVIATNNVPLGGGNLTFKGTGPTGGVRNSFFNAKATPTRGQRTFQIVRVPQYSNLTLNSIITTPPFNGVAGGVIAFNVSGTFNFNGNTIDGSARGFRGGYSPVATTNANDSKTYVGASNNTAISGKGEGIAGTPRYMWDGFSQVDNGAANEGLPGGSSGRGAPANAGGGGNDHNSGGGGGGNGGYGGLGGAGWQGGGGDLLSAKLPLTGGGRPGFTSFNTAEPELTRLIMGGGGGAGDANNAINGVKGGVGGAIILINAGNIQGSGIIKANGGPGAPGSYAGSPDGAGGGGAGGSVFLNISNNNTIATNVTIEANGGKGGNTLNDLGNSHGPGGGGGGGIIRYNVPGTGVTINPFVTAGASGGTDNGSANGESHGAQPGEAGSVKSFISSDIPTNLQVNASCFPILETTVKALTTSEVCGSIGEKVTYEIQIKNTGAGNAAGVLLDFTFPTNIEFDAATASYSTEASGPSGALSNTGTANNPLIGNFNIAQNGIVTIILVGKVAGAIAGGTYSSKAQAQYLDPTRSLDATRKITAATNGYGTVFKNYEGANQGVVPGVNFKGDDPIKVDDITILALPAAPTASVTTQTSCTTPTGTITVSSPANGPNVSFTLTGINPVSAPVKNQTGVFSTLVPGTYQVTTTNAKGCTSFPSTSLVINTVANAPTTTGVSMCPSGTDTLKATSACSISDTTGETNAGAGTSANTNNGVIGWGTAENITAEDNNYATVSLSSGSTSQYLRGTNYGFAIPSNATINGITVIINRRSVNNTGIRDNRVSLVKGGTVQTLNKAVTGTNWTTSFSTNSYGGESDLWGSTWTAADINAANFGVVLSSYNNNNNNSRTASVDYIQITVAYTINGTINWYTLPSGGTSIGSGNSFDPVGVLNSGVANRTTPISTIFYAECSNNPGCRTATNYVINAQPTITAVDPKSLCDSGSVILGATASAGTINWYTAATGGSLVATGTNSYTTPSLSATTDYYVEAVSNGCKSATRTKVTATVNTTPKITGTTPGSRCGAGTVPLSASASAGTISWYSNVTGGTPLTTGTIYEPNVSATTTYYVDATNNGCTTGSRIAVAAVVNPLPTANAGTAFTKTCTVNPTGTAIGSSAVAGTTYSWSPATGLSDATASNPTANPSATTTYTLTVTNTASGCTATGSVVVTVDTTAPTANAGTAFTKTCTVNPTGKAIGAAAVAGTTYSWSPATGLSDATASNPTANPSATTTYTLTATNTASGCTATGSVLVTVDTTAPTANAGTAFTKTCTVNPTGKAIGAAAVAGTTYSWSPATGLSNATASNPTANPSATTTYTLTATNTASGCTATSSVVVTVNTTAPTANAGTAFTKTCTVNPTGTAIGSSAVAGTTYSWSPATGLSNATASNPTANPSATTTYTLTATNTASGCTATGSVVVTVDTTAPTANAGTAFTKTCTVNPTGKAIGSSAVAGTTYSWSPATGLSDATASNPTANPSATTTYTLTATNTASGCTATGSVVVTVDTTAPTANAGTAFTKTCTVNPTGKAIGSSAVAGTTYSWSPATGLSDATASNPTANPSATTTYTLTVTNTASGCTATGSVVVTVDTTAPTANAGTAFTKTCTVNPTGKAIGAAAVAGTTYSWSPATGLSNATASNPTANPSATTTYTLTATNTASGCTATSSVVVTVDTTAPTANAGTAFTKTCTVNPTGKAIGSSAVAGTTYSWSPATGLSDATASNPTANPSATTTYTLTATNTASGCTATGSVVVTVDTTAPTANAGTAFTKTCTVNPTGKAIGSSAVAGTTYSWSPATGLSDATASNPTANPSATTTYTLTATNTASGCTATGSVLVTVDTTAPTANAGTAFTKTCTVNPTGKAIGAAAVAGTTYSWSPATGLSNATASNPTANPSATTTYTLTATNTASGCTATGSVVVTVNTTAPTANAGTAFTKTCTVNPTGKAIGSSAVAGTTYSWSPATGLSDATASNPTANPSATTTYTLTATNTASGCTATGSVLVTVDTTAPTANAGTAFTKTCTVNPTGKAIGAAAVAGTTYSWSPATGLSDATASNPTANPSATTTYTLTATNTASGCTATGSVVVTVDTTAPTADAGTAFTKTCTVNPIGKAIGSSAVAGTTYSWSPATGLSDATVSNPTANPSATTTYTLTATNTASGCTATSSVVVTVNTTAPTANAGTAFTKTCTVNPTGTAIGAAAVAGTTYSWSPVAGLSDATASNPTANPSATTTYTLTATNTASGCTATSSVLVTVDTTAPTANAGTAFTKTCTVNPTGKAIGSSAVAGTTYSWSPATGLSDATASNPTANPSATTTYTLTATNTASGCTATGSVVVTVDTTAPTANAGTAFTKTCTVNPTGKAIGAAAVAGTTYSWSPATGLSDATASNPTANPSATTTYTLTATNTASGCTATGSVLVTVDTTAPTANAGTAFTKTCTVNPTGKAIGAAAVAGTTYSWSPATGLSDATASNPTANPSATTTYTLTATNTASGCTATGSVVVTVDTTAPTANAGTAFTKTCTVNPTGKAIGSSAVAGTTYSWSPATGLSDATVSNPTANPSATTTYTLTATNTASGCTATGSVVVTVDTTAPTANAGTAFTKTCTVNPTGKAIGSSAVAGTTYSWSPATGLSGATASNPTANPSATTTYTLTATNTASGCTATSSVVVTVDTTAPTANAGTAFTKTCTVNPTGKAIGAAAVAGTTYSWSPVAGLSDATASNPTANPSATTTYTLTATNTASGCTATGSVVVTVDTTAPTANAGTAFTKTCTVNPTGKAIGAAAVAGTTYSWSPVAGLSDATASNPTANPSATTTYTLTVTNTTSGCTATGSVVVTVDTTAPTANAGTAFTKTCTVNPTGKAIGSSAVAGTTYSWSPATGLSDATVSNPTANPSATTTYTLTATNTASGCTATSSVVVTVNTTAPTANAGTAFTKTCTVNPTGTAIGAAAVAGTTYSWSPATGLSGATASNPTANPSATTTYTLTATNTASGCTATSSVLVTVDTTAPTANAGTAFTKTCTVNPTGKAIGAAAVAGTTYSWSPATGLSDATASNPTANPSATTTYTLTATNTASGCTATGSVVVTVDTTAPTANAGTAFTKTCTVNPTGKAIGAAAVAGTTYSWSPATGLSDATASNPTANPSATTTYTLTATNTASGCTATGSVLVTVDTTAPTANAGTAFTKTCTVNPTGKAIGAAAVAGTTYSWSPATGLSDATASNPTANPSATTTYTLIATNTASGCTATSSVVVTVDTTAPAAPTAPVDVTVCETGSEQTLTATATVPSGSTIVWYDAITGGNVVSQATLVSTVAATKTLYGETSNGTCSSLTRTAVVLTINAAPAAPSVSISTQPTCETPTGSILLSDLPSGNWNINPGNITGNTTNTTITGLTSGITYSFTVTNESGCSSSLSNSITLWGVICANTETTAEINGLTGGKTPALTLNDKLNGVDVVIGNGAGQVKLTSVTVPTGLTLNTDGTVTVAPNTPAGEYNLTYKICEVTNPDNCDQVTSIIVVGQPTIDAVTETTAEINGLTGGKTPALTLNDKLNGVDVVIGNGAGQVKLTSVTVPTGLTLNTDGTVTVAPNTPAGEYNLTYKICEVTNPDNCDQVTSIIVVGQPTIDAVTETTAEINGLTGGKTPALTLNDKLNGVDVVIGNGAGQVKLTSVTVPTGLTLNTDGTVTVAPNTPAGEYNLTYKICEVTNPDNCDQVTSIIVVGQPTIDAVTETTAEINGLTGGKTPALTLNDKLNGVDVVIGNGAGQVKLTSVTVPTGLTLNTDGTVTVAPNTPAGEYNLTYKICEVTNPDNCDQVTSIIVVGQPTIDAVTETTAEINGLTGGKTPALTLNDKLNGVDVVIGNGAGQVKLTSVTVPTGLTLNTDGTVTVAPNTPAGEYNLTYKICEVTNPDNCDQVTSIIVVGQPTIDAVTETTAEINGLTGGKTPALTLNDKLNGVDVVIGNGAGQVKLTSVTVPTGLTLNTDGTVTVAPNTPAGEYNLTYKICEVTNPDNCDQVTSIIVVGQPTIDAVTETTAEINGLTGGKTPALTLNDKLNGVDVVIGNGAGQVKLTSVTVPTGLTLNTDGTVTVAPNTPAGEYNLTYKICEVTNPDNCDQVTSIIVVGQPTIDAVTETTAEINGLTGGKTPALTLNDKLNGVDVVIGNGAGQVKLTSVTVPTGLTLNTDGTVTVAPNTPAGEYNLTYKICEVTNPDNCDQVTSIIVVGQPTIDAVTETTAEINGLTGGKTPALTLNDKLNGVDVVIGNGAGQVKLTSVTVPTGLTLNTDGTVTVAPNTPAGEYNLTYKICEVTNPDNCDQVTSIIVVGQPTIDAVTETTAEINGLTGGKTPALTLNDKLNGVDVVIGNGAGQVKLTSVTVPTGLTLNTDGTVTVAPNTPAGEYNLTYKICEVTNPDNCDQVTSIIVVGQPTIDAVTETTAEINGLTGGKTPALTLNDKLNGVDVVIGNGAGQVKLTSVTVPTGLTLNTDGTVTVAPNTPAGEYNLTYKICEVTNPDNCDQVTSIIVVGQPTIDAVTETTAEINGLTGGKTPALTLNDKLNGVDVVIGNGAGQVKLTSVTVPTGLTLNTDGTVTVAPNTPAGEYNLTYKICEVTNPDNCDQVTSIIVVGQPTIDAVTETTAEINGLTGGKTPALTLNDKLNGVDVVIGNGAGQVKLTSVTVPTGLTLNTDGTVTVAPNTPAGEYNLTYKICEVTNPDNCDQVTSIIVVGQPTIDAVTETTAEINGLTGGKTPALTLNDKLNGVDVVIGNGAGQVKLTSVTVPTGLTLNTDGTVTVAPNTPAGEYNLTYKICEVTNPDNCDQVTSIIVVGQPTIDAVTETTAEINGLTGGKTPALTLNDKLNGVDVVIGNGAGQVKLTSVTVPTGLTLNTDGTVTVAPNTPAGEYNLTYKICEVTNPDNCDQVTSIIVVGQPTIDAVTETTAEINGLTGGKTPALTLNDKLNGVDVVIGNGAGQVKLTSVTVPTGLTLNTDGTVTVAPNTPAGEYNLTYKICEVTNPDNCDQVTSIIVVGQPTIDAVTEKTAEINGLTGGKTPALTLNDKLNNVDVVVGINAGEVKVTPVTVPTGLTFNTDGTVTIAPNTPTGNYDLTYSICEITNPTNCNETTSVIVVGKPSIIANPETTVSINGLTGGTTPALTLNDKLNNADVVVGINAGNVKVTPVIVPTGLTLNTDGTVTIAPNTPAGNYDLTYSICEITNPTNCNETTSVIVVGKPSIIANPETTVSINGLTGGTTPALTLNDKLNNADVVVGTNAGEVKVTPVTVPAGLTLNADGTVTIAPNTPAGNYDLTYGICEITNPTNCNEATSVIVVGKPSIIANPETTVSINGNTGGTTPALTLNDKLNNADVIVGINAGNVKVTPVTVPTGLTLNADGTVTIAPNTPAGNYDLTYGICEITNPTNCNETTSVIVVGKPSIIANPETTVSINGNTGGTTPALTLNDKLNNADVIVGINAGNVKVTPVTVPTGLTLNADGTVTIAPNTPAGNYDLTYGICEVTNPTNCNEVTSIIVVGQPTIDAVTEKTAEINGLTGGKTPALTANDKLNNVDVIVSINAGNVKVTPVTVPAGLTLNADGTVTIAPNTPAGNYDLTYSICEITNPTNCNETTSVIVVGKPSIIANPETTVSINGNTGGTTPALTLNDKLNNVDVVVGTNAGEVKVTPVTVPAGLTLNTDGTVTIAPNTPAGNYDLTYSICEITNPTNCDEVTSVIVVGKSVIKALTENTLPINGSTGGKTVSLIDNVTLNGNSAVIKNSNGGIILTVVKVPTGLTLNPDGTVTVKPGTPVGNYEIEYTICEYLNPDNCVTVKSYVPVISGSLQANNDNAGTIDTSKGQSSTTSIFDNDTLNGSAVKPADVILTTIVSNPNLILKADGTIEVKSGTPTGNYELTYRICEALNASNCSQAVAKISVVNNPPVTPLIQLIINNDGPVNVDGINGSLEFINVFDNDLLKGLPINPIDVILNAPQNAYFEFNQDGTVNVKPNTPGGNYTMTYQVCEKANPTNCASATLSVFVEAPAIAIIKTAVFNDENNNKVADAGETITYKFKVTNTGNVPLVGVTVLDPLPGVAVSGQAINLGVNESDEYNFTATYKITQSDINKGSVSNQASVQARSNKGVLVDDLSDDDNNTGDQPTVLDLTSCVIKVFNAFSPNGDEKNKRFYIQGLECYPDNTVEIYNRWGILVYDVDNYNNEDRAFVGYSQGRTTVKQSEGLPEGTYFYILKYKDSGSNSRQLSGYLYINK